MVRLSTRRRGEAAAGEPLRIVVCVKQVPMAAALRFEPETLRLKREGVPLELNSCDIRAMVGILEWVSSEALPAEVIALTMGPRSAEAALAQCLALGCHRAVHLCDAAFAGSDTLATARTLAAAVRTIGSVDLVVCGRASTDAETGQVGPQVAELLALPQVTGVCELAPLGGAAMLRATRDVEGFRETVEVELPVALTIGEDFAPERYPSREARDAVDPGRVETLGLQEMGLAEDGVGAAGSPTCVVGLTEVSVSRQCEMLEAPTSVDQQAAAIVRFVTERAVTGSRTSEALHGDGRDLPAAACADGDAVWVVADTSRRTLPDSALELLGKARTLSAAIDGHVAAVLLGPDPGRFAKPAAEHGADLVLSLTGPQPTAATLDRYVEALVDAIRDGRPRMVLFASQPPAGDIAPRVAARLELGLTADCVDLSIEDGRLVQHKPAFGDAVVALITSSTQPEIATVRPGMFAKPAAEPRRVAAVEALRADALGAAGDASSWDERAGSGWPGGVPLTEAEVVIGVGMGLGGPERLADVDRLAERLGAVVGCTRRVADAGWLPRHRQIGLTGTAIAPRVYIALGVRGAFEHMCGVRRSGAIVGVNDDPDATIFAQVDLGVEADLSLLLPSLVHALDTSAATVD